MRYIIAGSRKITNKESVYSIINLRKLKSTDTIISGHASGVDSIGEMYAKEHNIPLEIFKADWGKYGKSAGYRRNVEMANNAEVLILIWDGESKGSGHMLRIAEQKGLDIFEAIMF